jgi:hypothetical protein
MTVEPPFAPSDYYSCDFIGKGDGVVLFKLGKMYGHPESDLNRRIFNLFLLFASCCVSITNNGTNIQPSTQQSFLFTLHM